MPLLTAIVRRALRFRGTTIALACLFLVYGAHVLTRTPYDIFPEFAPPEVGINTEAPGLAPDQVESLVTQPVEDAVAGTPGVQSLRSQSLQGISAVTVLFDPSTDAYRARQLVSERLAGIASHLPLTAAAPLITPLLSSTGDVQTIGLTSSTRSLRDLRTIADWTVRPHLLGIPSVADVIVYGGEVRQLQVQLEPDQLVRYRLSVADVVSAAQKASGIEGAGFVETPNQQIVLRTEGEFSNPAVLARTVIRWRNGEAVTLGDVATVTDAAAPRISTAAVQGRPGVIVKVRLQYGSNTLEVAGRVSRAVQDLLPTLQAQGVQLEPGIFRASTFIETALHNIRASLLIGAVLVAVVLFLFLFSLRTAAISCTAIPLSLLAAVVVLDKLGFSLNTMTLGGLAIAIGEVVDDAVIDVENVRRRLHENRLAGSPASVFRVILSASVEVRSAVAYATLAVVLVFLPVMTLSGLAGRIFAPLGAAYVAAILASLVVALTVTPALCCALLRRDSIGEREPPAYRLLRGRYERLLHRVERHRGWVVGAVAVLTVAGAVPLYFMSSSFLPTLKEHHFVLHMLMAPGTSLDASLAEGQAITRSLLQLPQIATVGQQVGRASLDEIRGPEASEFDIEFKPGADIDAAARRIRGLLTGQPGAAFSLNTFLTERINETLSGYAAPVAVNLYGDDLKLLDLAARRVSDLMGRTRGTDDLQLASPPGLPELTIRLRSRELLRRGLAAVEVLDAIHAAFEGATAGRLHEGNQTYDVNVILDPADRGKLGSVAALPIRARDGTYVALGQLADIFEAPGREVIQHESGSRVETITCGVDGRGVGGYEAELGRKIAAGRLLPPGVLLAFAGSAQEEERAISDLLVHAVLAAAGIIILLRLVLGHRNNLLLVLANLPFALVGGVLFALWFGEGDISLGSWVGFVTVFGITLRNSIMLLSHYEHLVMVESQPWGVGTSVRGAGERLIPILMTALVTAGGLLPLAIGRNAPGREVEGPMALVILGGLTTSTLLNLLVLPTLTLRWGRFAAPSHEED